MCANALRPAVEASVDACLLTMKTSTGLHVTTTITVSPIALPMICIKCDTINTGHGKGRTNA
jgi:hypothetical protein